MLDFAAAAKTRMASFLGHQKKKNNIILTLTGFPMFLQFYPFPGTFVVDSVLLRLFTPHDEVLRCINSPCCSFAKNLAKWSANLVLDSNKKESDIKERKKGKLCIRIFLIKN